MLPCSQRALILVLEHVGNFGVRLPPGCSRHGVSVHCLCVQMLIKPLCHRMIGMSKKYATGASSLATSSRTALRDANTPNTQVLNVHRNHKAYSGQGTLPA